MTTATLSATTATVLDEIGSWEASEASTDRIYAGDGTSLSSRLRARRGRRNPRYLADLREVAQLYAQVLHGNRRSAIDFVENMSTSDFSNLFGDILDRQLLAKYLSQPVQWRQIARAGMCRDFRTVKRFTLDGGEAILSEVKQLAEYPAAALTDGAYSYAVKKYGRRLGLSWEDMVNDDLDAFRSIPDRLGNAARRSEERFATALYASSTGPNGTFFSSGNKNIVTSGTANPALSISALQAGFTVLASQLDTDGAPIYIDAVYLVVPPALQVTANNILNATEIWAATGGGDGTGNDQVRAVNWMANKVSLITNPWLPVISTTNGNTSWYMFSDPGVGRPALEVGFLTGHEQPELFAKSPNATRIGGGLIDPTDGDFDSDAVEWKLRHVFGGTLLDPKGAFASNGSNT